MVMKTKTAREKMPEKYLEIKILSRERGWARSISIVPFSISPAIAPPAKEMTRRTSIIGQMKVNISELMKPSKVVNDAGSMPKASIKPFGMVFIRFSSCAKDLLKVGKSAVYIVRKRT